MDKSFCTAFKLPLKGILVFRVFVFRFLIGLLPINSEIKELVVKPIILRLSSWHVGVLDQKFAQILDL
jgi:hypothetical protein